MTWQRMRKKHSRIFVHWLQFHTFLPSFSTVNYPLCTIHFEPTVCTVRKKTVFLVTRKHSNGLLFVLCTCSFSPSTLLTTQMQKGNTIGQFLQRCLENLRKEFSELRFVDLREAIPFDAYAQCLAFSLQGSQCRQPHVHQRRLDHTAGE